MWIFYKSSVISLLLVNTSVLLLHTLVSVWHFHGDDELQTGDVGSQWCWCEPRAKRCSGTRKWNQSDLQLGWFPCTRDDKRNEHALEMRLQMSLDLREKEKSKDSHVSYNCNKNANCC